MQIQQIRNATIIISYGGKKFLIDPWLGPKDYMPAFESAVKTYPSQPHEDLPCKIKDIINVDAVILTHYHPDHWDEYASEALDKNIPFYVQSEHDAYIIKNSGFKNVRILTEEGTKFEEIKLYKTGAQHGAREIVKPLCEGVGMPYDSMGIVFKTEGEKTLYLAGDTIWCKEVTDALNNFSPEFIIINACGATVLTGDKLIMDIDDVKTISNYAKSAQIIASHMGNVSHLTVSREDIKNLNLANVKIPENGEVLTF